MQPAAPGPRRGADVVAWVGVALVFGALSLRRLGDFDLPWHLATGRQMLAERALPTVDQLAYTARPIQHTELVADLALAWLHARGGAALLQVFGGLSAAAILVALHLRTRAHGPLSWLTAALAGWVMSPWLLVRPATLSMLLLALLAWTLDVSRDDAARRRWALAALPPMFLVWGNTHGAVLIGLLVLWIAAAHRVLCRVARGRTGSSGWLPLEDGIAAWPTLAVAAASTALAMINTAGPKLLVLPMLARRDFATTTEWQRPDLAFFATEPGGLVLAALGLAALTLGREPDGRRAPRVETVLQVALGLALATSAVRLIAFAAVLVAPVVARRLGAHVRGGRTVSFACAAATSLLAASMVLRPYTSVGVGFEPKHFPEGAVAYIQQARPAGHMANFLPFGGYLAWRLAPTWQVLVDGRTGWVHDPALVALVFRAERDAGAFDELVRTHAIEWAVTRSAEGEVFGVPLAEGPSWTLVYFDDTGAVYARRGGPNDALARAGYRVFRHLTPPEVLLAMAIDGVRAADLAHDGALAARQAPTSPRALFLAACGALAAREGDAFFDALGRLDAVAPGHPAGAVLRRAWTVAPRR